jgi:hypothetical protein
MSNVPQILVEIKHHLETCLDEEILLREIESRLRTLREWYPSNRDLFVSHIPFLKSLRDDVCKQLRLFIELKEELPLVDNIEDYTSLNEQLVAIKTVLHGVAICQRVSKEIRELHAKLPRIQEQEELRQQSRIRGHILDLEREAPHCRRGHVMVIREKDGSYFWGCSKYPLHEETTSLSPKEKAYLS